MLLFLDCWLEGLYQRMDFIRQHWNYYFFLNGGFNPLDTLKDLLRNCQFCTALHTTKAPHSLYLLMFPGCTWQLWKTS